MANKTLQARLRDLKAGGLSYAELGRQLGVDRSTVSRWASGKRTPDRRTRERVYGRWRRSDKRLRNPGAVVDLSGYFRRVWFDYPNAFRPYNYRSVPRYNFPNNAAVVVTVRFEITIADDGGIGTTEGTLSPNVPPNGDIAQIVGDRFDAYINEWVEGVDPRTGKRKYPEGALLKIVRQSVVLRWLKR